MKSSHNLQYIALAVGGVFLAGAIAVIVIMVRPEQTIDSAQERDPTQAEQTITQQQKDKNMQQGASEEDTTASASSVFGPVSDNVSVSRIEDIIATAGLTDQLTGDGPFTFFIPQDQAFDVLTDEERAELTKPENRDSLAALVTYHIVPGKLKLEDFSDGENVKTLEGGIIEISVEDETYAINSTATVVEKNLELENGIVHVVDTILQPEPAEEQGENEPPDNEQDTTTSE